jgi:tetratricopeptide (TPR) repeat protein
MEEIEDRIIALYNSGKYRACLYLIDQHIDQFKDDPLVLGYRGLSRYQLGQYGKAIEIFDRMISIEAGNYAWWVFRGDCYGKLDKYGQAIHDYGISLAIDPENWSVYDKMGHCYFYSGETARGIALTEYAFEQGRVPDTALILILMLEQCGMRNRALQQAQAGAKEFPRDKRFLEAIMRIKPK